MVRKSPRIANPTVRAAVHVIILASAAALLPARRAYADPDPCTTSTNVLFCTGNQSNGINVQGNPNLLYLFIQPHTLTQNIAPAPGVGGISFTGFLSDGLFLDMNDGVASVATTGDNANALTVQTNGQIPRSTDAGDASILNADPLTTTGVHSSGIYAESLASHTLVDVGLKGGFVLAQTSANITTFSTDPNAQSYGIFAHSYAIYSAPASVAEIEDDGARIQTFGGGSAALFASSEGGYGANGSSGLSGSSGSPGGTGGPVEILGSGTLLTSGDNSQGILAISRGGIGGSGGNGYIGNAGNGVFGGVAGDVTVTGNWFISTLGAGSDGIRAESLGGEGGSGGTGYTFGTGGGAGGSGYATDVIVNVTGQIVTYGNQSNGIIAQSVGGFAGNGGNSYGFIAYGGSGESAGHGGNVTVTNGGNIYTFGQFSNGIVAQSIGGGGGSGGSGGAIYALGGSGAAGGAGESVTVINSGSILANGAGSRGIYAQSIGGGGGDGGDSGGLAAIGGSGASTDSTGGSVTVKNTLAAASIFSYSNSIFAESVGGGGGAGGSSTGWVSVGGGGGSGGDASAVTVVNNGQLTSIDDNASAIFAHSIGGSGGNGGSAVSGSIGGASFAIGGSGAQAGNASLVQVTNTGAITTGDYHFSGGPNGDNSSGIFAQSIGGGGGNGGFAAALSVGGAGTSLAIGGAASVGGFGNRVVVGNSGNINTVGDNSSDIAAESIGGGGGTGGFAIALSAGVAFSGAAAIGGSGAGGGDSFNGVSVTNSGNLSTLGDHSYGLLAQSVGGGGGNGGFAIAGTFSVSGAAAALSLGGSGGGGGYASAVNVLSNGAISTVGNNSTGLLAESIGGGGGSGGFAISASISGGVAADVALGGTGAGGGGGSTVNVGSTTQYTSGLISTAGNNSAGLIAQSIGGGGGNGGFSVAADIGLAPSAQLAMGGAGGTGNDSAAVSVYSGNSVLTRGNDSYGILAQSVGGGGGNGGFAVAGSINLSGGNLGIAMGGNGSYGGDAAGVTLFSTGNSITTTGARSDGLVAQSVGGGGGDGGFSVAADFSAGASANLSLGGNADHGGIANAVVLNSSTSVQTSGADSHAVLAQSVGGGGGSGGFAIAGSIGAGVGADVSLGGGGGGGGAANTVSVGSAIKPLSGTLITGGARSDGLLAQSVGGGGGDGGFSVAGSISAAPSLGFSLGGSGSAGAAANTVTVFTSSSVATQGEDSHGIVVQSVGGGGGTGGFSVAGSASGSSAAAAASIGGPGGAGGNGAAASLTSSGSQVSTAGDHAYGILVQSVGGGGGDGGFSVAGSFTATGAAAALSLGGAGLTGGTGSTVTVNSSTSITTQGAGSIGLFAQSLGGGGGDGGFSVAGSLGGGSAADVSIGGKGSGGGAAGVVNVGTVLNPDTGTIITAGDSAVGLLAQSIGGGGGNGGFSVAGSITQSPSAHLSIGGAGGTGSDAGAVSVFTANSIMTQGADASGLFAQSLGGGGGNGGFSVTGSINASGASAGVSIGGAGNGGGDAKAVSVDSSGTAIVTQGDRSFGLVAQSVGGGGGDGGFSVAGSLGAGSSANLSLGGSGAHGGAGGAVTVNSTTAIATLGDDAHAVFAQSLGGGGGAGGFSVAASITQGSTANVALGGSGGGGGDGLAVIVGTVLAPTSGALSTAGERSDGILAQSVGGGGGAGGFSVAGNISQGTSVGFSMGGSGGTASSGGTVSVVTNSSIATRGDDSDGILAQSVGGGGGAGGFSVAGSAATSGSSTVTASIGGHGGAGGDSNVVAVVSDGNTINTEGERSNGVLAQSVGGGGGNGGFSVAGTLSTSGSGAAFSLGGSGDHGGSALGVSLDTSSAIITQGDSANGLFAQSLGGGGGNGGFSVAGSISGGKAADASIGGSGAGGGSAGTVTVGTLAATTGNIITFGNGSIGLLAQSIGGGGGNGGFSVAGSITQAASAQFSLGGSAGTGSAAGSVVVDSDNSIATYGDDSHALFAQSLGGGGGNGGFSVAGSIATSGGNVGASIGGSGAGGGSAQTVAVTSGGAVLMTAGAASDGILAQSIGGGGGNGGFSVRGDISQGGSTGFSLGGSGGKAGNGSGVTVTSSAAIATQGSGSNGIFAQSVGGGGGNGGFSVEGSISQQSGGLNASIGGAGAGGGTSAEVTVTSSGSSISTAGDGADGIVAQSLGGGGGDGGFSVAGGISKKQSVNFSVGGSGDVGGSSGEVQVLNSSNLSTTGQSAYGIFAQSVGGGGGNGGFSVAGSLFSTDTSDPTIDASLGGTGKGGGSAGAVTVGTLQQMISGDITTQGDNSYGIFAQSTGGGGGNGGFSVAGGLSKSPQVTFSVGGAAGTASNGGAVEVYTASDIQTAGDGAHAVFAQSLGGGGGNGGFSIAGSGTADVASMSASLGGQGGGGGAGGDVGVTNSGSVQTLGSDAYGVYAQSIGGGGGNGGFSIAGSISKPNTATGSATGGKSFSLAIGGAGGNGDIGGAVTVTNSGDIQTAGDGSYAILAHSIGGGGGDGGFAATGAAGASSNQEGATSANIALSLGGNGGLGNRGGDVSVTNAGDILTQGADARGIYAYSVGGGGGNGGAALSFAVALGAANKGRSINTTISIGGAGGDGDVGGAVMVGNSGSVTTNGNVADAIFAQSIGGGGGSGGSAKDISLLLKQGGPTSSDPGSNWNFKASIGGNGGTAEDAGTVMVSNSGTLSTAGALSRGIFAQSVGGGGGDGADGIDGLNNANFDNAELLDQVDMLRDLHFTVGGSGGESGNGAAVSVTNTGSITTQGFGAEAIFAQSVGGGGGIAQSFASGSGAGGTANAGLTGAFELGGGGGAAGYGDTVTVINSGALATRGDYADGIFAQSVGGGGGVAGDVQRGINLPFSIPGVPDINVGLGPALGQDGGSGGDGHAVTVTNTASISTSGVGSFGIFAQSVGGGGGVAGGLGNDGTVAQPLLGWQNFYGSTGGSGNGGLVSVTQTGNITTTGATASGIFAQSVATLGTGGDVTVTVDGNISATGTDSAAVLVQSLGQQGSGNLSVIIQGGTLEGGANAAAGLGAAVLLLDGHDNTVENHGTLTVSDPTQFAVKGGAGNDGVINFGTINGSIALGAGTNAFDNRVASTFNAGTTVNLGAGNVLNNAGALSPAGAGVQGTTLITGNLMQSVTGNLLIDVNRSNMSADHVSVAGAASLAGTVSIKATPWLQSGHQQVTFLDSSQSLTTDTLQVVPSGSATVTYSLSRPDAHDLTLNIDTDYAATTSGTLNANQTAFGRYLNAVTAGAVATQLAPLVAQLQSTSKASTLGTQFDQFTPQGNLSAQSSTLAGNLQFSNALLSCRTRDGAYKFVAEGECTWFDVSVTTLHQSATADNFGFRYADTTLAGGVQTALGQHWHVGVGGAYDSIHTFTDGALIGQDTATGQQLQAGLVLKANFADTTGALSVSIGHRDDHGTRPIEIPQPGMVSSDPSMSFYAAHLRLSHAFDFGDWYARPILDGGYTDIRSAAYTETGGGGADLHINSGSQNYATLQPLLELGRQFDVRGGAVLRLFARAGVLDYLSDSTPRLTASLADAPQDIAPFAISGHPNHTWNEVSGGIDLITGNRSALRLSYSHLSTSGATAADYSLKFAIPID